MNPVRNIAYARRKNFIEKVNPTRNIVYSQRKSISNGVKVVIRNLQKRIPINPKRIIKTVLKILSEEGIKKSGEITICFVNDRKIRKLNSQYTGQNCPTDVLSFDLSQDKNKIFFDIVISTDTAISNSRIFKTTPLYELYLYVVHGILHLLGYNDRTAKQRQLMQNKEKEILENFY